MAVQLNGHLRILVILLYIGLVVQTILANNNFTVDAESRRDVDGIEVKYASVDIPDDSGPIASERNTLRPAGQNMVPATINSAECGLKNGSPYQERIVGGHQAEVGEWPWIAALFLPTGHFCGGTLIDNEHILTAAHCIVSITSKNMAYLKVHLGKYNITTNDEVRHIERGVRRVVKHEDYVESPNLLNDIAILTMNSPVQFTQWIRPVCLPSGSQLYAGRTGTAIGWGKLGLDTEVTDILREVSLRIWLNSECLTVYEIIDGSICAGGIQKGICMGDSGGPLMVNDGRWTQVGITSASNYCGKYGDPGVFTRISYYLPWIYQNLR